MWNDVEKQTNAKQLIASIRFLTPFYSSLEAYTNLQTHMIWNVWSMKFIEWKRKMNGIPTSWIEIQIIFTNLTQKERIQSG